MTISINVSSPGAIPDRDTLVARIGDYLDRDDLGTMIPAFIQMAEAMFNRELRAPQMERTVIGVTSAEDTTLPDDYLAMRAIYEEGSPDRPLKGISPTAMRDGFDGSAGIPIAYCLVGGSVRLIPPPNGDYSLAMDYFARIEPLSVYAPSNWLLEQHPDAYLYGTLFHAESYLDNAVRAGQWKGLVDQVIQRINKTSSNDRYGAGPLVPTGISQVRGARC